jgi:hypothetical protein
MSDDVWDDIVHDIDHARYDSTVFPGDPVAGARTLGRLSVSTRSTLGAIALHSGGWLVDHGWLRVLGGTASPGLPDIATVSGLPEEVTEPVPVCGLLVAYDVLGGQFAINGGGLAGRPGEVCYWAPDSLDWDGLDLGHTDFVEWVLAGDHDGFYDGFRWDGWEAETEALAPDQAWSLVPFLWTDEFDIATAFRRPVPVTEVFALAAEMSRQLFAGEQPFLF